MFHNVCYLKIFTLRCYKDESEVYYFLSFSLPTLSTEQKAFTISLG